MDTKEIINAIKIQRDIIKILIETHVSDHKTPYRNEQLNDLLKILDEQLKSLQQ